MFHHGLGHAAFYSNLSLAFVSSRVGACCVLLEPIVSIWCYLQRLLLQCLLSRIRGCAVHGVRSLVLIVLRRLPLHRTGSHCSSGTKLAEGVFEWMGPWVGSSTNEVISTKPSAPR
eukprot:6159289-Amphidinium_carterae.2